jgi:hypothetical protein
VSAASVGQQGRRQLLEGAAAGPKQPTAGSGGVMQALANAFRSTAAAAGATEAQSQLLAEAQGTVEGPGSGRGVSSSPAGRATVAPAAGWMQQGGEGGGVEGKRTKLRMGLDLPGEDLAAVEFLDVGNSAQAVSPEGAPAGEYTLCHFLPAHDFFFKQSLMPRNAGRFLEQHGSSMIAEENP